MLHIHFLPLLLVSPHEALSPATSQSCGPWLSPLFLCGPGGTERETQPEEVPAFPEKGYFCDNAELSRPLRSKGFPALPTQIVHSPSQTREVPARGPFKKINCNKTSIFSGGSGWTMPSSRACDCLLSAPSQEKEVT